MTLYSTSTRRPSLSGPGGTGYPPFEISFKVFPEVSSGRRFEYYRDQERIAQVVEDALLTAGYTIGTPVAWTPQIGQSPARVTVIGFDTSANPNVPPVTTTTTIIHSGTVDGEKTAVMTPSQGNQNQGDEPTTATKTAVLTLKNAVEALLPDYEIMYMSYNGVRYGQSPNRKGFHSFPTS